MSLARILKTTLDIRDLARELGVTVVQPDEFKREYIVTKDDARKVCKQRDLRAAVCEVGGDPLDD